MSTAPALLDLPGGVHLAQPNHEPPAIVTEGIVCGRALDVLRRLPDRCIDLVLTDPPFFAPATHYQSRVEWGRRWSDMSILQDWWAAICEAMLHALKPTAHVLVFCNADSFAAWYPEMFNRWDTTKCLIWDKTRPGMGRIWRHEHEMIIAARNADGYDPDDGKLRGDILHYPATLSRDRKHPVEKPVALLADLITACTPPGGLVADFFAGSGTTGEAAKLLGRRYLLVEDDPGYAQQVRDTLDGIVDTGAKLTRRKGQRSSSRGDGHQGDRMKVQSLWDMAG